jgi:hypothetical protein
VGLGPRITPLASTGLRIGKDPVCAIVRKRCLFRIHFLSDGAWEACMGVVRVFCRALLPSVFEKWHRQSKDEANMSRAGRIETWVILFIIIVIIVGIILI